MTEEQTPTQWPPPEGWQERAEKTIRWARRIADHFEMLADEVDAAIEADGFEAYLAALTEFPYKEGESQNG